MNVNLATLVASEICDFCAGLGSIWEPKDHEAIQAELMRRILPLVGSVVILDATELVEGQTVATDAAWLYGEFGNEDEAQAWEALLSGELSKPEVINCWSCEEMLTIGELSENDGFCSHCNNEIELNDE
ncbi:hypothetical protein [Rouxiella badensis]|uniref:hypothetical protein n=1 Tax=Rouxiella badensis TaxID=1646377 RepID=UPI0028A8647D|nr:hypothetical protein [Rouxiella badensis]